MSHDDRLLRAIEEVRDEARARDQKTDDRFEHLEGRVGTVVATLSTLEHRVDENYQRTNAALAKQAESLSQVASAAAKACDLALEAKKQAHDAEANTQTVVESALRIHGSSIALVVDGSVKKAVAPIVSEVAELRSLGETRALETTKTNEAVGKIVEELGLEDQVVLGRNVRPDDPKPVRALAKLSREQKVAVLGTGLVLLVQAVEFAIKLLSH